MKAIDFQGIVIPRGVKYMLISTLAFSTMQVLIKFLNHIHVSEILLFRAGITSIMCMIFLWRHRIPMLGNQRKWLLARGLVGSVSLVLFLYTIQTMPLGASVTLKYLSPVFTALFAMLFLKEQVRPARWLCFAVALAGIFLIKGFDTRIGLVPLLLGLGSAFSAGIVYTLIRKIGDGDHPLVVVNYFMFIASLIGIVFSIQYWIPPAPVEWIMLLGIGVLGYFAQLYMTRAFQIEAASKIVSIKYIEVGYALLFGYLLFGEGYELGSFLGISMVLAGMLLNVILGKK